MVGKDSSSYVPRKNIRNEILQNVERRGYHKVAREQKSQMNRLGRNEKDIINPAAPSKWRRQADTT